MKRRTVLWLTVVPLALLAAIGHWMFWYAPRVRPAVPSGDLPSHLLAGPGSEDYASAVWIAHPHQNLPALADLTGLDGPGLAAALRLAGLDMPTLHGVRIPPASALAVAVSEGGAETKEGDRWIVAARIHPLAAAFARLSGAVASNPWLGGGTVLLKDGDAGTVEVTIAWQGTTWVAASGALPETGAEEHEEYAADFQPAVAWIRHRSSSSSMLPTGTAGLFADDGVVELASRSPFVTASARLSQGRKVLDAAEALLVLVQRGHSGGSTLDLSLDQSLLILPLPEGTDKTELPRSAILYRPSANDHQEGRRWRLPGEQLLEIAGRELPRAEMAGWQIRATDTVATGRALAAAPELRALGADHLPAWGVWLDVEPAARELSRLVRGIEGSPLVRRDEQRRWQDAALVLQALARRPAHVEGFVDGEEMILRWTRGGHP